MPFFLRLRLSIMMFFQYYVWGIWLPMLAQQIGPNGVNLTERQQGWIFTVYGFGAILGPFIMGQMADRYFATERVLAFAHLIGGVLLIVTAYASSFWPIFILLFVYCNLYMPTMGLTNSLTFRSLGDKEQSKFPAIRLWGTIGWIAAGLSFGFYLDSEKLDFLKPFFEVTGYSSQFPAFLASWHSISEPVLKPLFDVVGQPSFKDCLRIAGAVSLLYGLYCFLLPHTPPIPASETDPIDKKEAWLESLELMGNRSFAVLVTISGLIGIMLAFYFACENFFLTAIGTDPRHTGAYMTIGQIAEVVVMLFVPLAVRKLGTKWTMVLGASAWALRFLLSTIGQPWWLMIATIGLHGFCFGFFFVVAQMFVDRAASGDIKASAQNLLIFVIYGMGTILGSIISGELRSYFKDNWSMIWAGPFVLTVICILAFIALFHEEEIRKPVGQVEEVGV
jgi:nucleoside transporter